MTQAQVHSFGFSRYLAIGFDIFNLLVERAMAAVGFSLNFFSMTPRVGVINYLI